MYRWPVSEAVLLTLCAFSNSLADSTAWVSVCCDQAPGSIARYDVMTGRVLPPLSAAAPMPLDAIYSPNGTRIFVASDTLTDTSESTGEIAVLNAASGALQGTVPLSGTPFSLVISSDGNRVYAGYSSDENSSPRNIYVAAIDTSLLSVTATASVGSEGTNFSPSGRLALSPDGKSLYLTLSGALVAFDTPTLSISHSITFNSPARVGAAVSHDGSLLFVPESSSGNAAVAAVDTSSFNTVWTVTIDNGGKPGPLTLDPTGQTLYAADSAGLVTVIPLASHSVANSFQLPAPVSDVASVQSGTALIAVLVNGAVVSLNVTSGQVTNLFVVPGQAAFESLSSGRSMLLVPNQSAILQEVDLTSAQVVGGAPIPPAEPAQGVAAFGSGRLGFAGGENGVTVINLAKSQYLTTVGIRSVWGVIAAPNGAAVYAFTGNGLLTTSVLWRIDPATLQAMPEATVPVNVYAPAAISADSQTLFVSSSTGLIEVNTSTFQMNTLPGSFGAAATTAATPSYLYVTVNENGQLYLEVLDYLTGSVAKAVPFIAAARLAVSANGRYVYGMGPVLSCLDLTTGQTKWSVSGSFVGFALTADQQYVVATESYSTQLYVYDAMTGAPLDQIPLAGVGGPIFSVQ